MLELQGQQSCTAGRAAFIGGAVLLRNGMTKVGLPGAKEGWQKTDVAMPLDAPATNTICCPIFYAFDGWCSLNFLLHVVMVYARSNRKTSHRLTHGYIAPSSC